MERKVKKMECEYCSDTTQSYCRQTGKCYHDSAKSTGWYPEDLDQIKRDAKNFDRVIGWIEGEE